MDINSKRELIEEARNLLDESSRLADKLEYYANLLIRDMEQARLEEEALQCSKAA